MNKVVKFIFASLFLVLASCSKSATAGEIEQPETQAQWEKSVDDLPLSHYSLCFGAHLTQLLFHVPYICSSRDIQVLVTWQTSVRHVANTQCCYTIPVSRQDKQLCE